MREYQVVMSKEWTEYGTLVVRASGKDIARDIARELLSEGSEDIEWDGSNMSPGEECVETVVEIPRE